MREKVQSSAFIPLAGEASQGYSKYDVNMTIYDAYGNIVAVDNTAGKSRPAGNPSLSVALTSGKRYFIRVNEADGYALPYTLYYNKE